jgi:hypothetical protein
MSFEDDHSETHRKVMARLAQMTAQERTRLLQEAGVLDDNGQLAERYLPPEDILVQQQRLRAAGDDLRLHFSITGQPAAFRDARLGRAARLGRHAPSRDRPRTRSAANTQERSGKRGLSLLCHASSLADCPRPLGNEIQVSRQLVSGCTQHVPDAYPVTRTPAGG